MVSASSTRSGCPSSLTLGAGLADYDLIAAELDCKSDAHGRRIERDSSLVDYFKVGAVTASPFHKFGSAPATKFPPDGWHAVEVTHGRTPKISPSRGSVSTPPARRSVVISACSVVAVPISIWVPAQMAMPSMNMDQDRAAGVGRKHRSCSRFRFLCGNQEHGDGR
jgi:hypothetical protein